MSTERSHPIERKLRLVVSHLNGENRLKPVAKPQDITPALLIP